MSQQSEYINQVILIGRAGQNPEYKPFESGAVKSSVSIAVRGQKKDETLWFDIEAWGNLADIIANYVKAGTTICVVGELTFDQWIDKRSNELRTKPVIRAQNLELLGSSNRSQQDQTTATTTSVPLVPSPEEITNASF